jgi:hypothetical protein
VSQIETCWWWSWRVVSRRSKRGGGGGVDALRVRVKSKHGGCGVDALRVCASQIETCWRWSWCVVSRLSSSRRSSGLSQVETTLQPREAGAPGRTNEGIPERGPVRWRAAQSQLVPAPDRVSVGPVWQRNLAPIASFSLRSLCFCCCCCCCGAGDETTTTTERDSATNRRARSSAIMRMRSSSAFSFCADVSCCCCCCFAWAKYLSTTRERANKGKSMDLLQFGLHGSQLSCAAVNQRREQDAYRSCWRVTLSGGHKTRCKMQSTHPGIA